MRQNTISEIGTTFVTYFRKIISKHIKYTNSLHDRGFKFTIQLEILFEKLIIVVHLDFLYIKLYVKLNIRIIHNITKLVYI